MSNEHKTNLAKMQSRLCLSMIIFLSPRNILEWPWAGLWHASQSFGLLARPQGWNRKSQIWAEYLSYVCVRLSIVGSRKLGHKHPIATYKSIIYAWFCKTDATLAWCSWRMWQVASLCNKCKPASTMWPRWRRSLRLSCKPSNRPVLKAECYVLGTLRQR